MKNYSKYGIKSTPWIYVSTRSIYDKYLHVWNINCHSTAVSSKKALSPKYSKKISVFCFI